jgi:hypothetical protein
MISSARGTHPVVDETDGGKLGVAVIVISNPHPRREIDPAFPVKDV